jgi:hypothetical protein
LDSRRPCFPFSFFLFPFSFPFVAAKTLTTVYNDPTRKCNGRALLPFFINRQNTAEWSIFVKKQAK